MRGFATTTRSVFRQAAVLLGSVLALWATDSPARAKPTPISGCHVLRAGKVADLDGDGRGEQLLRCKAEASSRLAGERRCDRVLLLLSQSGRHYEVAQLCRGGLGVAGIADRLRLGAKGQTLTLRRRGGSAWSWQAECTFDLQRRRVAKLVRRGLWTVEPRRHRSTAIADFLKGTSEVRWTAPLCVGRGRRPARRLFRGAHRPIPLVRTARAPHWPPGQHDQRCQLSLATAGYTLRGKLPGRHDLSLRLWAVDVAGKTLLLRGALRDNRLTSGDRLHLWLGRAPSGYTESCLRRSITEHVIGFGLDGAELSLRAERSPKQAGAPAGLSARVVRRGGWRFLELRLSPKRRRQALRYGLALGYVDVDHPSGASRQRGSAFLATARLDLASGIGLGELRPSQCQLDSRGRLRRRQLHSCATVLP
jgi:hypothetical protein